jgi:3-methylfumaryl-CoA hydratase
LEVTKIDIDHLRSWIGKTRESVDEISPRLAASLAAVLDEDCNLEVGDEAPPCIQWCLSPDIIPMSGLGPDGHPARGGFLPPVPLPRRMWAGGQLAFTGDLLVGDEVRRKSFISDVSLKEGRSGSLIFVAVKHEYYTPRGLALSERHDIVYRELESKTAVAKPADPLAGLEPDLSFSVNATPTLLMRYSAVTFNGHRIHYDRDYCRNEENYPGLVVHGPLQATCLLRLAHKMNGGRFPSNFSYRGLNPLFDGAAFSVNIKNAGDQQQLWAADAMGLTTMTATATI